MRTGWICLVVTVLGFHAAPGPDQVHLLLLLHVLQEQRSWEPWSAADFWGVRGKRSAALEPLQVESDALGPEAKRSFKPNSLFGHTVDGTYGQKRLKPNFLFSSTGKHTLKPYSLFSSTGKRTLEPYSLFSSMGKRSLKPNSLFGAIGKRTLKPNPMFGALGKRLASIEANSPHTWQLTPKRSILPTHWLLKDAAEEEGNNDADYEVDNEDPLEVKQSVDASFWAMPKKRTWREILDNFSSTRCPVWDSGGASQPVPGLTRSRQSRPTQAYPPSTSLPPVARRRLGPSTL
jgi:hypothetical protein